MLANITQLIKSYREADKAILGQEFGRFNDLEIGCSFDPFHHIFAETGIKPIDAFKYIHTELCITDIRLGIRWSHTWKNGKVDLSEYSEYFDYCRVNKLRVTLNMGPIKVMRWPEEHIPNEFQPLVKPGDRITLVHPIADVALKYLHELLGQLKQNYSDLVFVLQADNELFNKFGHYGLRISHEFERGVIQVIKQYFPGTALLINSSGTNDFNKIFELIVDLPGKFVLGVNYYYKTKLQHRTPVLNKLDNLILRKPFTMSPEKLKIKAENFSYKIEISELQGEPWWPNALTPGNDYREFLFTLLRVKYLKPDNQEKMLVRYWGIEDFVVKFLLNIQTKQNNLIQAAIREINLV